MQVSRLENCDGSCHARFSPQSPLHHLVKVVKGHHYLIGCTDYELFLLYLLSRFLFSFLSLGVEISNDLDMQILNPRASLQRHTPVVISSLIFIGSERHCNGIRPWSSPASFSLVQSVTATAYASNILHNLQILHPDTLHIDLISFISLISLSSHIDPTLISYHRTPPVTTSASPWVSSRLRT